MPEDVQPTIVPAGGLRAASGGRDLSEAGSPAQLQALLQLVQGYRVSQALYVVAKLGIADRLSDGPKDLDELAQATTTHAPTLFRLLRFLTAVGVFEEVALRQFALTPLRGGSAHRSRGIPPRTRTPLTRRLEVARLGPAAPQRADWRHGL